MKQIIILSSQMTSQMTAAECALTHVYTCLQAVEMNETSASKKWMKCHQCVCEYMKNSLVRAAMQMPVDDDVDPETAPTCGVKIQIKVKVLFLLILSLCCSRCSSVWCVSL